MNDKILTFPGIAPALPSEDVSPVPEPVHVEDLTDAQHKAIGIVLSGMSFICVGAKPAGGGSDFFTAAHGTASDLRDAQSHLPDVIDRALGRAGF